MQKLDPREEFERMLEGLPGTLDRALELIDLSSDADAYKVELNIVTVFGFGTSWINSFESTVTFYECLVKFKKFMAEHKPTYKSMLGENECILGLWAVTHTEELTRENVEYLLSHDYIGSTGVFFSGLAETAAIERMSDEVIRFLPRSLDYFEERRIIRGLSRGHSGQKKFKNLSWSPLGVSLRSNLVDPAVYYLVLQYYDQGFLPLFLVAAWRGRDPRVPVSRLDSDLIRLVMLMITGRLH